jgi:type I restriction enzyme M protein
VLNGSPLFNGAAWLRGVEIRRHLLENDSGRCDRGLADNMFFNTGIATYIWILDNTKQSEAQRQGPVD